MPETKTKPAAKSKAKPKAPKAVVESNEAPKKAIVASNPIRNTLVGFVVSDKMTKTIVVRVDRKTKHPEYSKFVLRSKNLKAHDETSQAKIGDLVQIVSCRPVSKDKRWALKEIIRRASGVATDLNVV